MLKIISDNYKTYSSDCKSHRLRLTFALSLSALFSFFGQDLKSDAFPTMSLAMSVLAGFTFTALFSSHSMTTFELPDPRDENDRHDIRLLKILGDNFQFRSKYFILLAIIDIILILISSTNFHAPLSLLIFFGNIDLGNYSHYVDAAIGAVYYIFILLSYAIIFLACFVFLECLHTFYRSSETILSILEIRKKYIETRIT